MFDIRRFTDRFSNLKGLLWNKQFYVFLGFFLISSLIWLLTILDETVEQNFSVRLQLKNVPSNVVVTTELPPTIQIKLRDKLGTLLTYRYGTELPPVEIDYAKYAGNVGRVVIPTLEVIRPYILKMKGNTSLVSVSVETLEFYYNFGQRKRVPIRFSGKVTAMDNFMLSNVRFTPDSVVIFAPKEILDTVNAAYVGGHYRMGENDSILRGRNIHPIRGAKFSPSSVNMSLYLDRMVSKSVQVPIKWVNFPASKVLRTFPGSVMVHFRVNMRRYRSISADNFIIVINYEDLKDKKDNRLHLNLRSKPAGVTNVSIEPADVDFVVEELPETE